MSKLKYEFRPEGEYLFQHGDEGSSYYIILEGEVNVQPPRYIDIDEDEETDPEDFKPIYLGAG